jgi:hypothetical protein
MAQKQKKISSPNLVSYKYIIILDKILDYIDDSSFIEIIGFCAFELSFPEPQPTSVEKVINYNSFCR